MTTSKTATPSAVSANHQLAMHQIPTTEFADQLSQSQIDDAPQSHSAQSNYDNGIWGFDTCASTSVTRFLSDFICLHKLPNIAKCRMAAGMIYIHYAGDILIELRDDKNCVYTVRVCNVLYCPTASSRLLAVSHILEALGDNAILEMKTQERAHLVLPVQGEEHSCRVFPLQFSGNKGFKCPHLEGNMIHQPYFVDANGRCNLPEMSPQARRDAFAQLLEHDKLLHKHQQLQAMQFPTIEEMSAQIEVGMKELKMLGQASDSDESEPDLNLSRVTVTDNSHAKTVDSFSDLDQHKTRAVGRNKLLDPYVQPDDVIEYVDQTAFKSHGLHRYVPPKQEDIVQHAPEVNHHDEYVQSLAADKKRTAEVNQLDATHKQVALEFQQATAEKYQMLDEAMQADGGLLGKVSPPSKIKIRKLPEEPTLQSPASVSPSDKRKLQEAATITETRKEEKPSVTPTVFESMAATIQLQSAQLTPQAGAVSDDQLQTPTVPEDALLTAPRRLCVLKYDMFSDDHNADLRHLPDTETLWAHIQEIHLSTPPDERDPLTAEMCRACVRASARALFSDEGACKDPILPEGIYVFKGISARSDFDANEHHCHDVMTVLSPNIYNLSSDELPLLDDCASIGSCFSCYGDDRNNVCFIGWSHPLITHYLGVRSYGGQHTLFARVSMDRLQLRKVFRALKFHSPIQMSESETKQISVGEAYLFKCGNTVYDERKFRSPAAMAMSMSDATNMIVKPK